MTSAVGNGVEWWSISCGCVVRYDEEPAIREADTANAQHLVTRPTRAGDPTRSNGAQRVTFSQFSFVPASAVRVCL